MLTAALLLIGITSKPPVIVELGSDVRGVCTRLIDGRFMSDKQMIRYLKREARRRPIDLHGFTPDVPFKCVGPTIFTLQRARVPLKVGFISEPPPEPTSSPRP